MINRAGNKEKAKRVLNENGNLSGMVGMEILYRVIAAITSVLLGAMIAGGIGVVSAVVSAPFKLFGLAGIIIAYVLITPIATLVGAIAGGAVAGPFEVARYRYYLSLRKNGIRPKVTCIFDAFDPHHLGKAGEEARPPRTEKNIFQVVRAGSSRRFLPN